MLKRVIFVILFLFFATTSCSVQKMAMESVVSFTKEDAIPYLMTQDDVASAAAMGEAFVPLIASMTRLEINTSEVVVASAMASGMAAEEQAREGELARLRAIRENRAMEAQDALIVEKQGHALAAKRFYDAYLNALEAYGDLSQSCPSFEDEVSELLALLGIASGALAILHDFNAEKAVSISLDVPVKIEKAAQCFDNNKWWGLPQALRASIWLSIPGSGPQGVDPLVVMKEAAGVGDASGVYLSRALWVQMAKSVGNEQSMCEALAGFPTDSPTTSDYALLSAYARQMARHQADVRWTQEEGHRAPFGSMLCPDNTVSSPESDGLENILDGLGADDVDTSVALPLDQVPAPEERGE